MIRIVYVLNHWHQKFPFQHISTQKYLLLCIVAYQVNKSCVILNCLLFIHRENHVHATTKEEEEFASAAFLETSLYLLLTLCQIIILRQDAEKLIYCVCTLPSQFEASFDVMNIEYRK